MAQTHVRVTPHKQLTHKEQRREHHHSTHSQHHAEKISKNRVVTPNGTHPVKISHHSGSPVSNPNTVHHHAVPQNEATPHAVATATKGASLLAAHGVLSGAITHASKPATKAASKPASKQYGASNQDYAASAAANVVNAINNANENRHSNPTVSWTQAAVLNGIAKGVTPQHTVAAHTPTSKGISLAGIAYGAAHGAVPHDPHRAIAIGIGNPPTITKQSGTGSAYTPQTYDYSHGWTPRNNANYTPEAYPTGVQKQDTTPVNTGSPSWWPSWLYWPGNLING